MRLLDRFRPELHCVLLREIMPVIQHDVVVIVIPTTYAAIQKTSNFVRTRRRCPVDIRITRVFPFNTSLLALRARMRFIPKKPKDRPVQ
jgi:hypothetical protein